MNQVVDTTASFLHLLLRAWLWWFIISHSLRTLGVINYIDTYNSFHIHVLCLVHDYLEVLKLFRCFKCSHDNDDGEMPGTHCHSPPHWTTLFTNDCTKSCSTHFKTRCYSKCSTTTTVSASSEWSSTIIRVWPVSSSCCIHQHPTKPLSSHCKVHSPTLLLVVHLINY